MASEYLKWKYRNEKPNEPVQYTKAERIQNWLYYNKWYLLIGVVCLFMVLSLVWSMLGIGKVKPDFTVAYTGSLPLPEETATALVEEFQSISDDFNGDGKVVVQLLQYVTPEVQSADDAYALQATQARLMGDLSICESYFFLMQDPAEFQKFTGVLCRLDGTLPPEEDVSAEGTYYLWKNCPVLSGMELGGAQEFVSNLAFARRGFGPHKQCDNLEGCHTMWDRFTKDAVQ